MGKKESENSEPNKAFFESNLRSKAIRDFCIELLALLDYLTEYPDPQEDSYKKAYSRLEKYEIDLMSLQIEMNMQMGRPTIDYFNDPVIAAEYIAGQIYNYSSRAIPNISNAMALGGEFGGESLQTDEDSSKEGMVVDMQQMPAAVIDFMVFREGWNNLKKMFDISNQELESYRDQLLND